MLKYRISWKSIQWEPSFSMQTDEQTDGHDEANIVASGNFANAPKTYGGVAV